MYPNQYGSGIDWFNPVLNLMSMVPKFETTNPMSYFLRTKEVKLEKKNLTVHRLFNLFFVVINIFNNFVMYSTEISEK
jgi:hypothetical protein